MWRVLRLPCRDCFEKLKFLEIDVPRPVFSLNESRANRPNWLFAKVPLRFSMNVSWLVPPLSGRGETEQLMIMIAEKIPMRSSMFFYSSDFSKFILESGKFVCDDDDDDDDDNDFQWFLNLFRSLKTRLWSVRSVINNF